MDDIKIAGKKSNNETQMKREMKQIDLEEPTVGSYQLRSMMRIACFSFRYSFGLFHIHATCITRRLDPGGELRGWEECTAERTTESQDMEEQ